MATIAELKTRLSEAETAYHNLMTGQQVVYVRDGNGMSVSYTRADMNKLSQYIERLKREIDKTIPGPMVAWF